MQISAAIRNRIRTACTWAAIMTLAIVAGRGLGQAWQQWREPPIVSTFDRGAIGELAGGQLVMIASSTCPACAQARAWLHQQGVAYRELTVDRSPRARAIADQLGVRSVPTFLFGTTRINGFVPDELQKRMGAGI